MADEDIELDADTILSAQEIDDVVSQFRLFNRRLSQQSVTLPRYCLPLTSPRQMHKFVTELPKVTEADLVASGHQGELAFVLALRFTPPYGRVMCR